MKRVQVFPTQSDTLEDAAKELAEKRIPGIPLNILIQDMTGAETLERLLENISVADLAFRQALARATEEVIMRPERFKIPG